MSAFVPGWAACDRPSHLIMVSNEIDGGEGFQAFWIITSVDVFLIVTTNLKRIQGDQCSRAETIAGMETMDNTISERPLSVIDSTSLDP